MACFKPLKAYKGPDGICFNSKAGYADMPLELPCGQCIGCRLERKRSWAIRCVHEAQMASESCFLTLTYSPENLPSDHGLRLEHWQNFAKAVRYRHGPFRFFHAAEYGDDGKRPHYHALIFGHAFTNDSVGLKGNSKHPLRKSLSLETLWPHGYHSIGNVSADSASYCASYVTKKLTGADAVAAYQRTIVDEETGECTEHTVRPEYATMSRRPGLGTSWFDRYWRDVYPDNFVVFKGQKVTPPPFYDSLLEKRDPELHRRMKKQRRAQVRGNAWNHTAERLTVRETVAKARLSQ